MKKENWDNYRKNNTAIVSEHIGLDKDIIEIWLNRLGNKEKFFILKHCDFLLPCYYGGNKKIWTTFLGGDIWRSGIALVKSSQLNMPDAKKNLQIALIDYLLNSRGKWHIFKFRNFPFYDIDDFCDFLELKNLKYIRKSIALARYINLNGSYDDFLNSKHFKKYGKKLQSKYKKLQKDFQKIEHKIYKSKDKLEKALEYVAEISAKSWKALKKTHIGAKDRIDFYRDIWNIFAVRGIGEIHLLWVEGKPVSFVMFVYIGDMVYLLKNGYDEGYKKYYIGGIVQLLAIEKIFQYGKYKKIDFLSNFKNSQLFCANTDKYYNLFIYNNTLLGKIAYLIDKKLKPTIKKVLKKCLISSFL